MALNAYLNKKVSVLTLDGRTMVGTLFSCDGSMNLVLADAIERIIRPADEGVPSEEVPLGLMAKKANGSEMREPSHALQELGYGPCAKRRYPRNDVIQNL
ncbi:hypothetical protein E8E11_001461 [Didymella keratinophila]|nr:hypothetical protein E8E11_001461 [Didymella keratinophila]